MAPFGGFGGVVFGLASVVDDIFEISFFGDAPDMLLPSCEGDQGQNGTGRAGAEQEHVHVQMPAEMSSPVALAARWVASA